MGTGWTMPRDSTTRRTLAHPVMCDAAAYDRPMSDPSNGSIAGLKVLDLSRVLAGPLCAQMLADHGAEVIKVEPPAGDETRTWGPPFLADGLSAYYNALNRNKKHTCLDLTTVEGQGVLAELLRQSDVLIENFKAGTLARWGFDDDRLERDFPRLVHCRISGFGVDGPLGGRPGYDAVLQAYSGLMSVNGEAEGPPVRVGVPVVDMVTGMLACSGVLLALLERGDSGRGQLVDATLLDSALALLHPHSATWLADGQEPVRSGSGHPTIAPYGVFSAAGRPTLIGAGNDRQFRELVTELGIPEVADQPEFATNPARVGHRDALRDLLEHAMADRDAAELTPALQRRGVPTTPISTVGEALSSPQVQHRGGVVELDGYRAIGVPITLSRTPGTVRTAPRAKGADTREVLAQLGYSADQISAMIAAAAE